MRLIDADELYDKAETKYKNSPTPYRLIYRGFVDEIADAQTVDAVPIVRCKDCIHYGEIGDCEVHQYDGRFNRNYFCEDGERKEDSND